MTTLTAELNNGQLNRAVQESMRLLQSLGRAGTEAGQNIDKIGTTNGPGRAGAGVADTQRKMIGLGSAASRATGAIRTGFAGAVGGIRSFGSSITGATTSFLNFRGAALGLVAGFSFGSVISELRGFDGVMGQVQGVTQATGAEFQQLSALARDLGRSTQFSGREAADGILFLARAGQDTNTIMSTLPATLKFAQAGVLDLGEAADFSTNIMGAFGRDASQTEQSLNALAVVANSSNTDIRGLASAMSFAGLSANSAGVSLEASAAAIGVLGDVGISASRAGTGLNQVLLNLSNTDPPDRVVQGLESLGLTMEDLTVNGAFDLQTALEALAGANIDLTSAAKLVGTEAAGSLLALTNNAGKVRELTEEAETNTTALNDMADAMANNLDGALQKATSAFSGLTLEIGARGGASFLQQAFEGIADAINFVTDNLDTVLAPVNFVIDAFTGLATSAINLGSALGATFGPQIIGLFDQAAVSVSNLTGGMSLLLPAVQGIIVAFSALLALRVAVAFTALLNPIGLAVTAIGALGGVLLSLSGATLPDVIRAVASFADSVVGFFIGLTNAGARAFSALADAIASPFQGVFAFVSRVIDQFISTFRNALQIGINLVGSFVTAVGGTLQDFANTVSDSTDPDTIIPPSFRAKYRDVAAEISQEFTDGLDFSGASDAIDPVLQQLEQVGPTTATSTQQATVSIASTEQALQDLGQTAQVAGAQTSTSIQTASASFQGLGAAAQTATQQTVTGIEAADARLIQLNESIDTTGTTAQGAFAEAGDAADQFDQRVNAVTGTFGQLFDELGIDIDQFVRNAETLANRLGTSFAGTFDGFATSVERALGLAEGQIGAFGGAVGVILTEVGVTGSDVFETLGIDADSKFAQVAGSAISVLGQLSDDQFAALLDAGTSAFGGIVSAAGSAISSFFGLGTSATTANTAITTSGAAATTATTATGTAAQATEGSFSSLGDTVRDIFAAIGDAIRAFFDLVTDIVSQVIDTIANGLTTLANAIGNAFATIGQGIGTALEAIFTGLANGLTAVGNAATASVVGLAIAAVFLAVVAVAAIAVAVAIDLIVDALIRFTEFLFDTAARLDDFVNDVADAIDLLIERISQSIQLLIDNIVGSFGDLFNIVPRIVGELVDAILNLFQVLIDGIVDLFLSLAQGIADILTGLLDIIIGIFAAVGQAIVDAITIVIDIFAALGDVILQVFLNAQAVIEVFVDLVLTLINGLVDAVVALFQGLGAVIEAIFDAVGAAAGALADAMVAIFDALGSAVSSIFSNLFDFITDIFDGIRSFGLDVVGDIIGFFGDLLSAVLDVFGTILSVGIDTLTALVGLLREIIALLREIIELAAEASSALSGISLGGGGGGGFFGGFGGGLGSLFAQGGLITGQVNLSSPSGLSQSRFRSGGVLNSVTSITGGGSVVPTRQLGIAGEAGPEFIVPAVRTPDGDLGIKAIAPPQQAASSGPMMMNTFNIDARGAGDEVVKELRAMVREVQRSTPVVAAQTAARVMNGVVRT